MGRESVHSAKATESRTGLLLEFFSIDVLADENWANGTLQILDRYPVRTVMWSLCTVVVVWRVAVVALAIFECSTGSTHSTTPRPGSMPPYL